MYGDQFREFVCGYWGFKGWGGCHVAVGILLLYLHFSLSLSQFQPIFVFCHHFCYLMSLFQGHVACQNFTLTCRASFAGCVLFISVTKSLKYIKLLFDDVSLPRSELFSQAMACTEVVALCHVMTTSCNWACVFLGSSKLLILPSHVYFQSVGVFNHVMF